MKNLSKVERTVSSETMSNVLKFAPKDGFRLEDNLLNKEYTVIGVEEYEIGKTSSFSVSLQNEDGIIISLSGSALKRSRVIQSGVEAGKKYNKTENVLLRSEADSLWNGSSYFHTAYGMKKDEEFVIHSKLKLRYAVLYEDQETNKPLVSSHLYKGFKKLVKEYSKNDSYPTMDDFREELSKSKDDGRYDFLPVEMTKPEVYPWVKNELGDFRHTLVFEINE